MRFVLLTAPARINRTAIILAGALVVLTAWSRACAQMPKELAGCWLTTRALKTTNVQSLSPAEAHTFLGRKLKFSPSLARSGAAVLQSPQYYVRQVKDEDFTDAFAI